MKKLDQYKDNKPANAKGLPEKTFKDKMTLFTGNDAIDLYYFGPAHTGGDALVVFRNLRVMATGDMAAATGTPIIDLDNGGSGAAVGPARSPRRRPASRAWISSPAATRARRATGPASSKPASS